MFNTKGQYLVKPSKGFITRLLSTFNMDSLFKEDKPSPRNSLENDDWLGNR